MSLSTPFIHRPVGTTLLTIAVTLAGAIGFFMLPVSPLPQVEFPTISVQANLPGASPETMASAVATPLERAFSRIAGITEMTSTSNLGATSITLQFDLNRNIDAAARDVQAAINAARGRLPPNLPNNPSYKKVNPSDSPVMILAITSETYTKPQLYDAASTILQQKLSQVRGVGQVVVGGGSPPAVRVDLNPTVLNNYGLGLDQVRTALNAATVNRPKGLIDSGDQTHSLWTNDQLLTAAEYRPVIVAYRNGAPVRLADIATVADAVEDIRTAGMYDGKPSITVMIYRQPEANIIDTVDRIYALLPQLEAAIPAGMDVEVSMDRTTSIRASVHDVEFTLCISIGLVILVVFLFLRDWRATLIPSVAVPVSLIGTFGLMYLCGYSIDNLSMMAMTITTGFVVDDAIVVIENIARHLEEGKSPLEASLLGAKEIGFTVLSISVSLIAVFIPILLMQGIVGRLFREFAITLSASIIVSLIVSLTTTPMMCAYLLKSKSDTRHGWLYQATEGIFDWILRWYGKTLAWVLRHQFLNLMVTFATIAVTIYLYVVVPKGFFPQQDSGRMIAQVKADQDTSFQTMVGLMNRVAATITSDPAVDGVIAFTGGQQSGASNSARMFVKLKPKPQRDATADEIIGRLRKPLGAIPGVLTGLQSTQDLRIGGRTSATQYQFTLRSDSLEDLNYWAPRLLREMRGLKALTDLDSDQQMRGLQSTVQIDRTQAARLGISTQAIDEALYDAFGQRPVAIMYKPLNQYRVVMGVQPEFLQDPNSLNYLRVRSANGTLTPLSAVCRFTTSNTSLQVAHSGLLPSITISFNLAPGYSLGDAVDQIEQLMHDQGLPANVQGNFAGTAQAFQDSLRNQPLLILAALVAVYIVLGMLYESYIHPITILSTLPSAGVGAILALILCRSDLNVMGLIGILLLIGIVKKNAIMMIDFALDAERQRGSTPEEAIFEACIMRFRPITMTTMAALLGGLPLALGTGTGSELRRPLGIAIVGGLIVSQFVTLYTTPVVYLYLDRFRLWCNRLRRRPQVEPFPVSEPVFRPQHSEPI